MWPIHCGHVQIHLRVQRDAKALDCTLLGPGHSSPADGTIRFHVTSDITQ